MSMDRKTTVYKLEAGKIAFCEKRVQAIHSNVFPYFTGLPVSLSLYRLYSSRAWLHNSCMIQCKLPVTRWCNNLSLAGKQPVWIKLPLTQIQYLRKVPGFPSAAHIYRRTENCYAHMSITPGIIYYVYT